MLRHVRSGKWTWPPGNELCGRRFGTGLQSIESFISKRRSNMIEVCLLQKDFSCAFLCLRLCDLCSWNDSDGMEDYRHWRDWLAGCRDQQGAPFMIMGRMIGCFIMIAKAWVSDFSSVGFDVISLIEFPCWRWDLGWFPAYCWLGFTVWFPSSWLLRGNGIWYIVEISQSCYMCICIYIYIHGWRFSRCDYHPLYYRRDAFIESTKLFAVCSPISPDWNSCKHLVTNLQANMLSHG